MNSVKRIERLLLFLAVATVIACVSTPAFAYSFSKGTNYWLDYTGVIGEVVHSSTLGNVYAGAINLSVYNSSGISAGNWLANISTLCVTPNIYLQDPFLATYTDLSVNNRARWILQNYSLKTSGEADANAWNAGMQLAVWDFSGGPIVTGGSTSANNYALMFYNDAVSHTADGMSYVDGFSGKDANGLQRSQDLIPPSVPEPVSVVLGVLGLISVAGFRRLRK